MIKRLCSLVAIAAVGGALVAGCGSSSSSSSSAATPAASPSSPAASTSTGSSGGAAAVPANLAAAVAQCKASIGAAPSLSADAKTKLESLCDQAASGKAVDIKKTTAEVCVEIVKDSVPASAQAAALAACPKP